MVHYQRALAISSLFVTIGSRSPLTPRSFGVFGKHVEKAVAVMQTFRDVLTGYHTSVSKTLDRPLDKNLSES